MCAIMKYEWCVWLPILVISCRMLCSIECLIVHISISFCLWLLFPLYLFIVGNLLWAACIEYSMYIVHCHLCGDDIILGQYQTPTTKDANTYITNDLQWNIFVLLFVLADVPNTAREMFTLETKLYHTKTWDCFGVSSVLVALRPFFTLTHKHTDILLKHLFTLFASSFSLLSKLRFNIVRAEKALSIAIIYHIILGKIFVCVYLGIWACLFPVVNSIFYWMVIPKILNCLPPLRMTWFQMVRFIRCWFVGNALLQ